MIMNITDHGLSVTTCGQTFKLENLNSNDPDDRDLLFAIRFLLEAGLDMTNKQLKGRNGT